MKNESADNEYINNGTAARKAANRIYKATVFAMVFQEKTALLNLYNAMNKTAYQNPDELEINTLENAIYMNIRNDVSFLIDSRLNLYEHQSTNNPNMPLRFLMYIADLYSVLTRNKNLYGTKQVLIPAPQFLVFHNGTAFVPDEQFLRLSAAFLIPEAEPSLELVVRMLNINSGHNQELMAGCKDLQDYAEFTRLIRAYKEKYPLAEAVDLGIHECIQRGILKEFLEKNKAEVKKVSIYEYDAEKHIQMERKEAWEEGEKEGRKEGIALGEKRSNELIRRLMSAKRYEDLERAADDEAYRKQLFMQMGLL